MAYSVGEHGEWVALLHQGVIDTSISCCGGAPAAHQDQACADPASTSCEQ